MKGVPRLVYAGRLLSVRVMGLIDVSGQGWKTFGDPFMVTVHFDMEVEPLGRDICVGNWI